MRLAAALALLCAMPAAVYADVVCSSVQTTCATGSSGGGGGASTSADNSWTGTQTFVDNKFLIGDDGDPTKKAAFQLSGITTGQTRTLTVPNASGTIPLLNTNNNWTDGQYFSYSATAVNNAPIGWGSDGYSSISLHSTAQTAPGMLLGIGPGSNSLIMAEKADYTFNFAHPAQTHPTLFIHSANQSTTQWVGLSHDSVGGLISSGTSALTVPATTYFGSSYSYITTIIPASHGGGLVQLRINSSYGQEGGGIYFETTAAGVPRNFIPNAAVALTDATATNALLFNIPQGAGTGGIISYTVIATSGGSVQTRSGTIKFVLVNQGGTEACTFGTPDDLFGGTGTLTVAFDCTYGIDSATIRVTADSSLDVSSNFHFQIQTNGGHTRLAQYPYI